MSWPVRWQRGVLVALLLALHTALAADQGYSFEASEFAKKPYEFGGYLEAKPQYFWLNPGSAGYNLAYPNGAPSSVHGVTGTLELYGKYTVDIASVRFRTHSDAERYNTVNEENNKLYEGVFSLRMYFLYSEVTKKKLVDAWNEGFDDNLDAAERTRLGPRIERFNGLFRTVHKGDVIHLDYLPGTGTAVSIDNEKRGVIEGEDFMQAWLRIWLGRKPADSDLEQGLLGAD